MKQLITLASILLFFSTTKATVRIVTCQNQPSHFLPVTLYADVGDTVHWVWVDGGHIVGPVYETDIPELADSWNGVINTDYHTFDYVLQFPGDYHYVCHPASPHGEDGYIVVSGSTGLNAVSAAPHGPSLYPNPFNDQLTLALGNASGMTICNALGEQVRSFTFTSGQATLRADVGTLPKGVYFVSILQRGAVVETRRMVKQ